MSEEIQSEAIKKYLGLRDELLKERAELENRIRQIDSVLSSGLGGGRRGAGLGQKRIRNKISLRDAIKTVTTKKALTKQEILDEIGKLGYQFTSANPINSLNAILYSKGLFKNDKGKFRPAK